MDPPKKDMELESFRDNGSWEKRSPGPEPALNGSDTIEDVLDSVIGNDKLSPTFAKAKREKSVNFGADQMLSNKQGLLSEANPAHGQSHMRSMNIMYSQEAARVEEHDGDDYSPKERVRVKKQKFARRFLNETFFYAIFMVVFTVVTYGLRSTWTFYTSDAIREALIRSPTPDGVTYLSIRDANHFWDWSENILFPAVYPTKKYNGSPLNYEERQLMLGNFFRLGRMRFRQVRVQANTGCVISDKFAGRIDVCYPPYNEGKESVDYIGSEQLAASGKEINKAFIWRSSDELCDSSGQHCSTPVFGQKRTTYPRSGYAWDFASSYNESLLELKQIREEGWLNLTSRAIVIDISFYNPALKMVAAVQLLVEVWPTGLYTPTDSVKPMELLQLKTTRDWAVFIGEVVLLVIVFGYLIREVAEFRRYYKVKKKFCPVCRKRECLREGEERTIQCVECKWAFNAFRMPLCPRCGFEVASDHLCWKGYFQDSWNYLDIVNQAFFITVFTLRFQLRASLAGLNLDRQHEHLQLHPIAWQYALSNWLNSVNALLCFFKVFKYAGKIRSLSTLVKTLGRARSDLFYFIIIFGVIFVGFALSFHLAFGTDIDGFKDWSSALVTLWLSLLGEFDYPALQVSNRVLAPVFFVFYQLVVFFVLANMFIAVISGAHEEAKEHIALGRDDFLSSSLKLWIKDVMIKLGDIWPGLFGHYRSERDVRIILSKMGVMPGLSPESRDDLHHFLHEIEHSNRLDLCLTILKSFPDTTRTSYEPSDYEALRAVVVKWRREQNKQDRGLWEDGSSEDEDSDEEIKPGQKAVRRQSSLKEIASVAGAMKRRQSLSQGIKPDAAQTLGVAAAQISGLKRWQKRSQKREGIDFNLQLLNNKTDELIQNLKSLETGMKNSGSRTQGALAALRRPNGGDAP